MFITADEMKSHIRQAHRELISLGDDTILAGALDAAMAEAKGYLTRYDTQAIFKAQGKERHSLLVIFIKDIAIYHFINFCCAGVEYATKETRYKRAVEWLEAVQKGNIVPDLPKLKDESGTDEYEQIYVSSNPKRTNHY